MFLVTCIATLRERTSGTLERLLTMPLGKADLLAGYALAFGAVAVVQAGLVTALSLPAPRPRRGRRRLAAVSWSPSPTPCWAPRSACSSARSRATEFQAVQFMPAFILPQFLLCGLLVARATTCRRAATSLRALPLTYAYDALARDARAASAARIAVDVAVILGLPASPSARRRTLRRTTP